MRGKRSLTPEQEAQLLRLDDLAYSLRLKNLARHFNIPEPTLRNILWRLRRERREQAAQENKQNCNSACGHANAT